MRDHTWKAEGLQTKISRGAHEWRDAEVWTHLLVLSTQPSESGERKTCLTPNILMAHWLPRHIYRFNFIVVHCLPLEKKVKLRKKKTRNKRTRRFYIWSKKIVLSSSWICCVSLPTTTYFTYLPPKKTQSHMFIYLEYNKTLGAVIMVYPVRLQAFFFLPLLDNNMQRKYN